MTNDGGPVWPNEYNMTTESGRSTPVPGAAGLTIRDYFAGLAMQGIVSAFKKSYVDKDDGVRVGFFNTEITSKDWLADCAADAYTIADAMLKERGQG